MKTKKKVVKSKKRIAHKSYVRGKISLGFLAVGLLALAVIPTVLLSQNRVTNQQKASGIDAVQPPVGFESPCGTLGDANNSGRITLDDGILVNQWVANYNPSNRSLNSTQLALGDVDGDGRLTVNDALIIGRYADGKEYTFKACNLSTLPKERVCGAYGDVDGDGKISVGDANDIISYVVGNKTFNDYQKKQADVNKDGTISSLDSLMIANYIAGKPGFGLFKVCNPIGVLACGTLGDVDEDGIISDLDATRLSMSTANLVYLTDSQQKNADANSDGTVNIIDALTISRYANNLDPILKGCTVKPTVTLTPNIPQSTPTVSPTVFIYNSRGR